jgi:hypothetical protein
MEGSGSVQMITDPDSEGLNSYGSGSGHTVYNYCSHLFISGFPGFNATHNSAYCFTRGKITKILGLGGRQTTILDELGISTGKRQYL